MLSNQGKSSQNKKEERDESEKKNAARNAVWKTEEGIAAGGRERRRKGGCCLLGRPRKKKDNFREIIKRDSQYDRGGLAHRKLQKGKGGAQYKHYLRTLWKKRKPH